MTNDDLERIERLAASAKSALEFLASLETARGTLDELKAARDRLAEVRGVLAETLGKLEQANAVLTDIQAQARTRKQTMEQEARSAAMAERERIEVSYREHAESLEKMKTEITAKGETLKQLNDQILAARREISKMLGRI